MKFTGNNCPPPFPLTDSTWSVMTVWRIREKVIRTLSCTCSAVSYITIMHVFLCGLQCIRNAHKIKKGQGKDGARSLAPPLLWIDITDRPKVWSHRWFTISCPLTIVTVCQQPATHHWFSALISFHSKRNTAGPGHICPIAICQSSVFTPCEWAISATLTCSVITRSFTDRCVYLCWRLHELRWGSPLLTSHYPLSLRSRPSSFEASPLPFTLSYAPTNSVERVRVIDDLMHRCAKKRIYVFFHSCHVFFVFNVVYFPNVFKNKSATYVAYKY